MSDEFYFVAECLLFCALCALTMTAYVLCMGELDHIEAKLDDLAITCTHKED